MHGRDAVIKMLVSEYGELKNFLFLFYRNSSISIETFTLSARLRHLTDGDFEFVIAQKRI